MHIEQIITGDHK